MGTVVNRALPIAIFAWSVTWNYAHSPFKLSIFKIDQKDYITVLVEEMEF